MSNSIICASAIAYGIIMPNSILGGNRKYKKLFGGGQEVTWERARDREIMPVPRIKYFYKQLKPNSEVVFNIENNK